MEVCCWVNKIYLILEITTWLGPTATNKTFSNFKWNFAKCIETLTGTFSYSICTSHQNFVQEFHATWRRTRQVLWSLWNIKIFTLKGSRKFFFLVQHGCVGNILNAPCKVEQTVTSFYFRFSHERSSIFFFKPEPMKECLNQFYEKVFFLLKTLIFEQSKTKQTFLKFLALIFDLE